MNSMFNRFNPNTQPHTSGMTLRKFTQEGISPFKDLNFATHQVFELSNYTSFSSVEKASIEKNDSFPPVFEIWVVPSVFNTNRLMKDMEKVCEDKENPKSISLLQNKANIIGVSRIERQFVVVNRMESKYVTETLENKGLSLLEIPEMVARVIKVKYRERKSIL